MAAGAQVSPMRENELWKLLQEWREIYCKPIHERTGKWSYGKRTWHTFSHGFYPHQRRRGALQRYQEQDSSDLLVLPDEVHSIGFFCASAEPIDFSPLRGDVCIVPRSFEWTMVFTHHQHEGWGPYFAEKDIYAV